MTMTIGEAKHRIQSTIEQLGTHAAPALERILADVRSGLGTEIANELIDEFDLELRYNLPPTESEGSGD
jgi:hypothetical protein